MGRGVIVVGVVAQVLALIACGSGGSDPSGASSSGGSSSTSSSGGSSGASSGGSSSAGSTNPPPSNCTAICSGGARIAFEEDNSGDRLDGATVEACHESTCATGILGKNDAGDWSLGLVKASDQGGPPFLSASVGAPSAGTLRIQISWDYANENTKLADGDQYTVKARVADGPILVDRTFTATYGEVKECGSVCKFYEVKP